MEDIAIDFMVYMIDKSLILIPVLLVIGKMLKVTPGFPDWCIPWALLGCGILLAFAMLGFTVDVLIQGVFAAGAAVYGNQLWKQTRNREQQ